MSGVAYAILWLACRTVARLCFRYRVEGADRLPQGGVLIAANHASYLDIPLVGCGLRRRAWYLGRQDLFGPRWIKAICRWLGWIPIRLGRVDREGFRKAVELIDAGKVVVIYPEGTRTLDGRLQPGKPGLGMIVEATKAPVVPAYIDGAFEALPTGVKWIRRHPIRVTFGAPIDFSKELERGRGKMFYQVVSRTVMERIAELGHVPRPVGSSNGEAVEPFNAERG